MKAILFLNLRMKGTMAWKGDEILKQRSWSRIPDAHVHQSIEIIGELVASEGQAGEIPALYAVMLRICPVVELAVLVSLEGDQLLQFF
ncbi:uncharacterized protein TRIVIDRAFT_215056 [Trichoderma virens Gv29-8]|uniref:Uncharacterized protein n=1 Tax=Hypocrea virens (strain Gv29-8 / FGSC 10586) TaxID=413071 RepID=G9MFD5_HYPVG|nr:uncharacterized protein TRIVIDRAFT_215056 [Trichoderma virens Gv29-8]EHK27102.1 hypothetical protein TRIVIDRAFT_215056 [Trichoderma virens Gv29-8]